MTLGKPPRVCSGLLGDVALSQYDGFNGKMVLKSHALVLKRLCISHTGEDCSAHSLFRSPGREF